MPKQKRAIWSRKKRARTEPAKKVTNESDDEREHAVEAVLRHKVYYYGPRVPSSGRRLVKTLFTVRWKGYGKASDERLDLEKLTNCPDLVFKYVQSVRRAYYDKCVRGEAGSGVTPATWHMPPPDIPSDKYRTSFEYIPNGTEYLRRVLGTFESKGVTYYNVRLQYAKEEYVTIRKALVDYFFPIPMILYYEKKQRVKRD